MAVLKIPFSKIRPFLCLLLTAILLLPSAAGTCSAHHHVSHHQHCETNWGNPRKSFTPCRPSASYHHCYADVSPDCWYYHAVMTLTEGGLLSGYGGSRFGPDDPMTEAQCMILDARLRGNSQKTVQTSEQNEQSASRAFAAVYLAGRLGASGSLALTNGEAALIGGVPGITGAYLHPGDRAAACHTNQRMYDCWRAVSNVRKVAYQYSIDDFPDADAIRQWIDENADRVCALLGVEGNHDHCVRSCEDFFLRAWNLGLFSGMDGKGTFNPRASITRGQYCQVLYNVGWTSRGCLDY